MALAFTPHHPQELAWADFSDPFRSVDVGGKKGKLDSIHGSGQDRIGGWSHVALSLLQVEKVSLGKISRL